MYLQHVHRMFEQVEETYGRFLVSHGRHLSVQFLLNNGLPTDDIKCSDQLSDLKVSQEVTFMVKKYWSICWHTRNGPSILIIQKIVPFRLVEKFTALLWHSRHNANECSHWCKASGNMRGTCWTLSCTEGFDFCSTVSKEFLVQISIPAAEQCTATTKLNLIYRYVRMGT